MAKHRAQKLQKQKRMSTQEAQPTGRKKKKNKKVKSVWVTHAGERTRGVGFVTDPNMVTDAVVNVTDQESHSSTTINTKSGTLPPATVQQNDVKYAYRMVTADEADGHSTMTTSSPVEWVGTGKNKHQEQIKNKHVIALKKRVIHKVKHKIPQVKTITVTKKIKPGQDSTLERVFSGLVKPTSDGVAFQYLTNQFSGVSVDRAVTAPTGRIFRAQHAVENQMRAAQTRKAQKTRKAKRMQQRSTQAMSAAPAATNPSDVFYCGYFGVPDSYLTSTPVVKFVLPHGNTGLDDPYSVTDFVQTDSTKVNVCQIDQDGALQGLKKVLFNSAIWERDFYNGMFILNDEPVNMRYTTGSYLSTDDLQLTPFGYVLYLRRSYGANGTNAKLPTYSDAVWFSNQAVSHDMALRSEWNSGQYIWHRTSAMVNGSLVTSYNVWPCPTLTTPG